jgi:glycosyltransferase involved in cell wall biosynthesis
LKILRLQVPEMDWRLSLAGDGEEMPFVRRIVEEAGLEGSVAFKGRLATPELADWFRGIDLYVHASDGETLSLSILQAMASGVPVIGSPVPGITNLLEEGRFGVLAAAQSPDAFAAAIRVVACSGAESQECRGRALAHVRASYSTASMFSRYMAVINAMARR